MIGEATVRIALNQSPTRIGKPVEKNLKEQRFYSNPMYLNREILKFGLLQEKEHWT